MANGAPVTLPVEPLWRAICDQMGMLDPTISGAARYCQVNRTVLSRCKTRGRIEVQLADRIAVSLGLHPIEVYGDAWCDAVEIPL
jgi:hypothetical protein